MSVRVNAGRWVLTCFHSGRCSTSERHPASTSINARQQASSRDTLGLRRALCENWASFAPFSPDGQDDHSHYRVPRHGTARILTQPKNSDNEPKQTIFHTEDAGLLSGSAAFALRMYAPPAVGWFAGRSREG